MSGLTGPDKPCLVRWNHCLEHLSQDTNPLAERRILLRPTGPPSGGIPTGMKGIGMLLKHQSAGHRLCLHHGE